MIRKDVSPKTIRRLGWLLIFLGLFLSGSMAWLSHWLQGIIEHPSSGAHWNGDTKFTTQAFGLFAAVGGFGVVSVLNGVFQAATGRRHLALQLLMAPALVAIFYYGSGFVQN
ncbi:unnamed protein product [Phaeothamnion confervicola]